MEVVQQDRCRSSLNRKARRKSKMKILKKLKPEERGLTRTLWEQVFTEDTKEFLDYYYTEKTKNNEIYVIETDHDIRGDDAAESLCNTVGKKAVESRYIVAVATEASLSAQRLYGRIIKQDSKRSVSAKNAILFPDARK